MRRSFCIIQRLSRATGSGGRSGTGTARPTRITRVSRTVAAAMSGLIVLATSMIPADAATVDVAAAPARTQIIMMKDNGEVIETPAPTNPAPHCPSSNCIWAIGCCNTVPPRTKPWCMR